MRTEKIMRRGNPITARKALVGGAIVAVCLAGAGIAGAVLGEPPPTTPVSMAQGSVPMDTSPQGLSLQAQLQHNADTGWTPVGADAPGGVGYVRTKFMHPNVATDKLGRGEAAHVYDANQNVVGYWVNPLGFVSRSAIEGGRFDWVAAVEALPQPQHDQAIKSLFPDGVPGGQSHIVVVRAG